MRGIIPIEIEDAEKILKEKIRTIQYYSHYHGTREEDVFRRSFYDINGRCLKTEEITQEQYNSDPRDDIFVGVWS